MDSHPVRVPHQPADSEVTDIDSSNEMKLLEKAWTTGTYHIHIGKRVHCRCGSFVFLTSGWIGGYCESWSSFGIIRGRKQCSQCQRHARVSPSLFGRPSKTGLKRLEQQSWRTFLRKLKRLEDHIYQEIGSTGRSRPRFMSDTIGSNPGSMNTCRRVVIKTPWKRSSK